MSVPGFNPFPGQNVIDLSPPEPNSFVGVSSFSVNPAVINSIFDIKQNKTAVVVGALIMMAELSWKERKSIDPNALLYILNSTAFYAGVFGSLTSSSGQKGGAALMRQLFTKEKGFLRPLSQPAAIRALGSIVDGMTSVLATTGGFQTFSQAWLIITKEIPEARTLSGFLKAEPWRKQQLLDKMIDLLMTPAYWKRIKDSVWYYRLATFDFVLMNTAFYMGIVAGNLFEKTYGARFPKLGKVAPVLASSLFGIGVDVLLPDSAHRAGNLYVLQLKIDQLENEYARLLASIERGVERESYNRRGKSDVGSKQNLIDDISEVFQISRLLAGLHYQRILWEGEGASFHGVGEPLLAFETSVGRCFDHISKHNDQALNLMKAEWRLAGISEAQIQEIEKVQEGWTQRRLFYFQLLETALEKAKKTRAEMTGLVSYLSSSESSLNLIDADFVDMDLE